MINRDDLNERVKQFQTLSLPGQPMGMHMGTSYLVNDLHSAVTEQADEIEQLTAQVETLKDAAELADGALLIALERGRQIVDEGYNAEHDSQYEDADDLIMAAMAYATVAVAMIAEGESTLDRQGIRRMHQEAGMMWPWDSALFKPGETIRRNLEKAGALIAAQLDVLIATENQSEPGT